VKNPHAAALPGAGGAKRCHSGGNAPSRFFVMQRVLPSGPRLRLRGLLTALATGLVVTLAAPQAARAETVIERAARTGEITMAGPVDVVPLAFVDDKKQLVGYSLDVARRIEAEVADYLGRPVKVVYTVQDNPAALFRAVHTGEVDLACGVQFTWEREMAVDFSMPFGLSGIRLLTRQGGLDGSPAALAGKRIGVVKDSLGSATLTALQPKAVAVPFAGIEPAVRALMDGKVVAVAGDSLLLAGAVEGLGGKGFGLVPPEAFSRYAVGCILPENQSTFRNLVNLAIAKLLQGYLNGNQADVATVERWLGPKGILELPPEVIRSYFQTVLLGYESIRVPSASPSPAAPR
jgi:polar amino acid transport system substrate-binding protein